MVDNLKSQLRADLNAARKERDRERTMVLTTTLSDLRNLEIEKGREAAEQMRAGGRPELAEKEEREAELLGRYLPEPLDEAQVRKLVREAIASGADNVGAVMGRVMPGLKGRFDGRDANRIVREELG